MTCSGTRVTVSGHARPRDGQTIASAIVATANDHSERASTATRIVETARWQKESVTSHGESAFVHATANGPWRESATCETGHVTPETVNGHSDALHENLDLMREINLKSGSGPQ